MTAETPSPSRGSVRLSRTWLAVAALLVVAALVAFAAMRRQPPPPAEADCEKQPPPTQFQVAECDQGTAPAASKPAQKTPASH